MSINDEYYVIERAGGSEYPLLEWHDDENRSPFYKRRHVPITKPIKLELGPPVPDRPVMVDYHSLPEPVIGQKIVDVIDPLSIDGIQLVPADVEMPSGENLRYWLLHVLTKIACMDRSLSKAKFSDVLPGRATTIDHLVLDEKILSDIPLEKRLIFVLEESVSTYLFHESIMNAIMSVEPVGCRFFRVAGWNDSAGFR
ncbi:hypothetical protein OWA38_003009 [Vibrio cholerae]|nr:hypothetical protein [Vibrio cholerae]